MPASPFAPSAAWRTPAVVIICGCLLAMITFGPRASLGLFLTPLSSANGWSREVFALALAIQNLLWGVGQPIAGGLADRFGTLRVFWLGAVLYGLGLALMAYSTTPIALQMTAGVLIGFGLAGCSFNLVLSAFAKLVPDHLRSLSLGAGTAAGSFGQFLFSPLAAGLNQTVGWQMTLVIFGMLMIAVVPLAVAIATRPTQSAATQGVEEQQSVRHALTEAFGHTSYVLLVLGFFTCGFQLAFITVHLPAYLVDRGLSVEVGAWTIALIGLFNVIGSLSVGWLGNRMPKRYILSAIYFGRAISTVAFILLPTSPVLTFIFGAVTGLLWLSTVAPTSGLVVLMFGKRWLAMLFGFCFFSHQVGGFLGVLLGGIAFEKTGSYDVIWWLSVFFGVASAIINLPIVEKPVQRTATAAA